VRTWHDALRSSDEAECVGFACLNLCQNIGELGVICCILLCIGAVLTMMLAGLSRLDARIQQSLQGEAALLGMISFGMFFVSNWSSGLSVYVSDSVREAIEFMHISIFTTMLFYLCFISVLVYQHHVLNRRRRSVHAVASHHSRQSRSSAGGRPRRFWARFICVRWSEWAPRYEASLQQILHAQFEGHTFEHDSAPGIPSSFDWPTYVQACSNSVLAHMVHVSLGSWCVALLTFGCVFGVTKGLYSLDQQKYDESWRHDFCEAAIDQLAKPCRHCLTVDKEDAVCTDACLDRIEGIGVIEKNAAMQYVFLSWAWTVSVVAFALHHASTAAVFKALAEGTIARALLPAKRASGVDGARQLGRPEARPWRRLWRWREAGDGYSRRFLLHSPSLLLFTFKLQLLTQSIHCALCTLVFFWIPPPAGVVILHCLPSLLFAGVVTRFTLERASLLHSIGSLTSAQRVASALILPKDRPQASKAQHERALVLTE